MANTLVPCCDARFLLPWVERITSQFLFQHNKRSVTDATKPTLVKLLPLKAIHSIKQCTLEWFRNFSHCWCLSSVFFKRVFFSVCLSVTHLRTLSLFKTNDRRFLSFCMNEAQKWSVMFSSWKVAQKMTTKLVQLWTKSFWLQELSEIFCDKHCSYTLNIKQHTTSSHVCPNHHTKHFHHCNEDLGPQKERKKKRKEKKKGYSSHKGQQHHPRTFMCTH